MPNLATDLARVMGPKVSADMNGALCAFAMRWELDGDYIRCRKCTSPQLTTYSDREFLHRPGCKAAGTVETHPWRTYLELLAPLIAAWSTRAASDGDSLVSKPAAPHAANNAISPTVRTTVGCAPLTKPFGNPEQLPSLEQRARELLAADKELNAAERDLNDDTLTSEEKQAVSWPRYYAAREKRADAILAITAALANQREGDINPSGPSFQAGYDTGHSEFQWLAGLVNNPVCERCGATSDADAETKCRPTDCSCPGTEFPLAQLWSLQRPGTNQQGVGGWQPIETAPKDGEIILLADISEVHVMVREARWDATAGKWAWPWYCGIEPTLWMPLPPPTQPAGDVGREG